MRKETRVIGIDDSPFDKNKKTDVLVIGTIYRGGQFMDGLVSTKIRVDGNNSTDKLIEMINSCKFKLKAIFLDGIALGGFNVVDVKRLSKETKLPVIVIIRRMPDLNNIKRILRKIGKSDKIRLIDQACPVHNIGKIYCQLTNINLEEAKELIKLTTTHSFIPEPIRIAHIICQGIIKGESKGRA